MERDAHPGRFTVSSPLPPTDAAKPSAGEGSTAVVVWLPLQSDAKKGLSHHGQIELHCGTEIASGPYTLERTPATERTEKMERPEQGDVIAGAGRGALILAMAGSGWLGWGLGTAQAFNAVTGPIFGFASILLWICSIYAIRAGRTLRRQAPASAAPATRFPAKSFILVALVEALAIALVLLAAEHFHRFDLAALGCTLVVALHYLPLARIFHAPILKVSGLVITSWCVLSWVLFKSNALVIAVTIGTGILLWATSIAILLRARRIFRSSKAAPAC